MQQSWDAANGSPQVRLAETAGSEALYGVYCRQLNIKMDSLNVKKKRKKKDRWVLAFSNVIYVCYIKVTMNNTYGMCWLALLSFFPLYVSDISPAPDGRYFPSRAHLLRRW